MSSVVSPYASPPPLRSSLFKNTPETIPSTDELESLHAELRALKQRTLERAKKAGEDLKVIEESMRRLKEKEKGKAKATEKVKRERGFTPLPNGDTPRMSVQPQPIPPKPRVLVTPAAPATSTPAVPADPRKLLAADELRKKKKKRKREELSDAESEPVKARKTSPLPTHSHLTANSQAHSHPQPPPPPPPRPAKYPSTSLAFSKPATGPDFALPPQMPLLPPRPPVQPAPVPGPSKPTEVMDDFSKSKIPTSQVQISTFLTSVESYIRPIKEEDIGFLEFAGDDVEPFVMPPLGRHYTEVWEEEDIARYGGSLPSTSAMRATAPIRHPIGPSTSLPRWEPSTLMDTDLVTEEKGHGPLTERLVSALIPMHSVTEWKGVKAAEEAMEGRPGTNGAAAAAARDKLNVADLEERVRSVLRFNGFIEEVPDFSEAVDDPIATALRHAQRELRSILAANKCRRKRLTAVAMDRLAYQEYLDARDSIDKNIMTLFSKLHKKAEGNKSNKNKKKKSVGSNGAVDPSGSISTLPLCPAAIGFSMDSENRLSMPDQLKKLVQIRREWVDTVGSVFQEKERENPGRIWGLPRTSLYEGIEDEVREEIARLGPPTPTGSKAKPGAANEVDTRTSSSKGKERASGDAMDIG